MGTMIPNGLVSLFVAIITAIVTVQLSIRKFSAEKWWEKKAEAYEHIIGALHDHKAFSDTYLEAEYKGKDVPEETDNMLRKNSKQAHLVIERAANMGGFIISKKAQDRLRRYQKEALEASNSSSWFEYLDSDLAAASSCMDDIIQIAKEDLRIRWFCM